MSASTPIDPTLSISGTASLAEQQALQNSVQGISSNASAQSVTFDNMSQLQSQQPALYKAIMESIAWNICTDSNNFNNWMMTKAQTEAQESMSQ